MATEDLLFKFRRKKSTNKLRTLVPQIVDYENVGGIGKRTDHCAVLEVGRSLSCS